MTSLWSVALLLLQTASTPPVPPDDATTVVVTAPLPSLRQALERCEAGGCTPRQDVVASIRYAEAVFRAGRYYDARQVLQQAIARDRAAAASEPIAVAALYEATVTVALHDGEQDVARHASGARVAVLRARFGEADPRFLQAELDDIDLQAGRGHADETKARYVALERRARVARQPVIVAAAVMRQATLLHAEGEERGSIALLDKLIAEPDQGEVTRTAARAMLASFARARGDAAATDRLAADGAAATGTGRAAPMLLWQPPLPSPTDTAGTDRFNRVDQVTTSSSVVTAHWVDIGFQIQPDGTVVDAAVLRGNGGTDWAKPILAAIVARRYSVTSLPAEQRHRVERWSLTADYDTPIGSLIRRRLRRPHYVQIDLTSTAPTTAH